MDSHFFYSMLFSIGFITLNLLVFSIIEKRFSYGRAFLCDLTFGFINPMLLSFFLSRLLHFSFSTSGAWGYINLKAMLPTWLLWTVIIIFMDGWGYMWHLLFHQKFLWRFHFIHHSSGDLRWHSHLRFHPIETLLTNCSMFLVLGLFGMPFTSFVYINLLIFSFSSLAHSNVDWTFGPIGKIIISPAYHSVHHMRSTQDKNLGNLLMIWDQLLNKSIYPDKRPAQEGESSDNWFKLIVRPFRLK